MVVMFWTHYRGSAVRSEEKLNSPGRRGKKERKLIRNDTIEASISLKTHKQIRNEAKK
jgi:hypothetical protein